MTLFYSLSSISLNAQPIPKYTIHRTANSIVIDGILNELAWQSAPVINEFSYPWFTNGQKELTEARMIWDKNYLYVAFVAHDQFISAYKSERDSPVSQDDCVEVFIAPNPSKVQDYFNYEIAFEWAFRRQFSAFGAIRHSGQGFGTGVQAGAKYALIKDTRPDHFRVLQQEHPKLRQV